MWTRRGLSSVEWQPGSSATLTGSFRDNTQNRLRPEAGCDTMPPAALEFEQSRRHVPLRDTKRDSRLAKVVGRHFDLHLIADTDADEVFSHLAGDVGQHLMPVGQGHAKHRARQNLGYRPDQFDWFFFCHAVRQLNFAGA